MASFKGQKVSPMFYIVAGILAVSLIFLIVGLAVDISCRNKMKDENKPAAGSSIKKLTSLKEFCNYSPEAERIGLKAFLKKVQKAYFEHTPNQVSYDPDVKSEDMHEHLKKGFFPYDPRPEALKKKTDAALTLLAQLNGKKYESKRLKPRENRVISQVKHYLQTVFGAPYESNFYAGDWMLGPNYFCWQTICYLGYDVNALGWYSKLKTKEDIDHVIKKLKDHSATIDNYIANIKLGVKAGMVRAKIDCKAGLDAFKESYKMIGTSKQATSVLKEWFAKKYLSDAFYANINTTDNTTWIAEKGKNIKDSVKEALVEGVGKPILKLINYLEFNHSVHCLPNDFSSGLGNLPVSYVYVNGTPGEATTKKMPITGTPLSGKDTYKILLRYFTTTDISPEMINIEGERQLKSFYNQTLVIAKKIMKDATSTNDAVTKFKKYLDSDAMWHGTLKFPENESNAAAHKACYSHATAKLYCPVRYKSMQIWAGYMEKVMSVIYPKLNKLFHFNGERNTVPNCPIEMEPHYNPSNGAQYFQKSDAQCSYTTRYGMPFFLEKYGPRFQEWSLTGHEGRPGHHTQYQGTEEHFRDKCGGLPSWFDKQQSYTVFVEGWALYAENPLLSHDTDLYKDNMLQEYGMTKWQTWRAVRLIVDTGLHYRGRNMTWARKMFEDFTWDTGDFARKEIVRYMSDPGQATAYMLGRLEIIKMRKKAEKELGFKFNLKDFHYQVLSQGSSPIDYLKGHIDRYIDCVKNAKLPMCEYILTPVRSLKNDMKMPTTMENRPKRPTYLKYM